jgi:hypothetical protein
VIGLALLDSGTPPERIAIVRAAVLRSWCRAGRWRSFWWATPTYAAARSLELLAASGGVPPSVVATETARLAEDDRVMAPPLEVAQRLAAAVALGAPAAVSAERWAGALLTAQCADGGWAPSPLLLVPGQADPSRSTAHADHERVFGTAQALTALAAWRGARSRRSPWPRTWAGRWD